MARNEGLEFISVNQNDEDFSMNSANRANFDDQNAVDSVIGSTFLKYSKHPIALLTHLLFKVRIWGSCSFILIF